MDVAPETDAAGLGWPRLGLGLFHVPYTIYAARKKVVKGGLIGLINDIGLYIPSASCQLAFLWGTEEGGTRIERWNNYLNLQSVKIPAQL